MKNISLKSVLCLATLALISCRHYGYDDYKGEVLGKYLNSNMQTLVLNYGVPQQVLDVDDMKLVVFESSSTTYQPRQWVNAGYGRVTEIGGYTNYWLCRSIFYLKDDKVIDARFEGNDCYKSRLMFEWK